MKKKLIRYKNFQNELMRGGAFFKTFLSLNYINRCTLSRKFYYSYTVLCAVLCSAVGTGKCLWPPCLPLCSWGKVLHIMSRYTQLIRFNRLNNFPVDYLHVFYPEVSMIVYYLHCGETMIPAIDRHILRV